MSLRIAYLVPDTYFFIQCDPIEELDWSHWKDYQEIHIIVTRPVQKEIDSFKSGGNQRRARRARRANTRFRKLILSETDHELIERPGHTLKLLLDLHNPHEDLGQRLDYSKADDELVGTACTIIEELGSKDHVWLLAHDTGLLLTAKAVDIQFFPIPDEWELKQETSSEQKRIKRLEEEVYRLQQAEPKIVLNVLDRNNNMLKEDAGYKVSITRCRPLSDDEVAQLVSRIKLRFPMATNFDAPNRNELSIAATQFLGETFVAPPRRDLVKYQDEDYPTWIRKCEDVLRELHIQRSVDGFGSCTFAATNEGTRPADDVLVTFEAKGEFFLAPAEQANTNEEAESVSLPRPPVPPKGEWKSPLSVLDVASGLGAWEHDDLLVPSAATLDAMLPAIRTVFNQDPNEFYWLHDDDDWIHERLQSECKQWRHGKENQEVFRLRILSRTTEPLAVAIECRVEAANTSSSTLRRVLLEVVPEEISVFDEAEKLVDDLVSRSPR